MNDENAATPEQRNERKHAPRSELVSLGALIIVLALAAVWFVASTLPYAP